MDETLDEYRRKVLKGEEIPAIEYAALVDSLRIARKAAKVKKEPDLGNLPMNLNDLFAETKEAPEKK